MTIGKWIKRWAVQGSGPKPWTVSLSDQGVYGCSCPRWKFKREECHHIQQVKAGGGNEQGEAAKARPIYTLAHVCTPTIENDKLLIPLVPFGDVHMNATICVALMQNGYSWREVKELRGTTIGPNWTAKSVLTHVEHHGKAWRKCCKNYPHTERESTPKMATKKHSVPGVKAPISPPSVTGIYKRKLDL
jgi:hypothetical protein